MFACVVTTFEKKWLDLSMLSLVPGLLERLVQGWHLHWHEVVDDGVVLRKTTTRPRACQGGAYHK